MIILFKPFVSGKLRLRMGKGLTEVIEPAIEGSGHEHGLGMH